MLKLSQWMKSDKKNIIASIFNKDLSGNIREEQDLRVFVHMEPLFNGCNTFFTA